MFGGLYSTRACWHHAWLTCYFCRLSSVPSSGCKFQEGRGFVCVAPWSIPGPQTWPGNGVDHYQLPLPASAGRAKTPGCQSCPSASHPAWPIPGGQENPRAACSWEGMEWAPTAVGRCTRQCAACAHPPSDLKRGGRRKSCPAGPPQSLPPRPCSVAGLEDIFEACLGVPLRSHPQEVREFQTLTTEHTLGDPKSGFSRRTCASPTRHVEEELLELPCPSQSQRAEASLTETSHKDSGVFSRECVVVLGAGAEAVEDSSSPVPSLWKLNPERAVTEAALPRELRATPQAHHFTLIL